MMYLPGWIEWVLIMFVALFRWGIPIAFAIWVFITLNAIRQDVAAIRSRLEAPRE